jgi:hypothetical protein
MEALLDKFDAARQSDVLDVRRKSVVKRGWFS